MSLFTNDKPRLGEDLQLAERDGTVFKRSCGSD